jgi:RNA polymerase sigma-54 factor
MAIELKQSLKLSQQLLITPQLQQAIKLLQLSRAELVETVQKELMENPVLEEAPNPENVEVENPVATERLSDLQTAESKEAKDKEFDWANYVENYNSPGKEPRSFSGNDEQPNFENMVSNSSSLHDHLEWQVKMAGSLSDIEEEVCISLIGNLGDDGYLRSSLEELTEKTPFSFYELEDGLCIIQELDPPGVGARNLQECLTLQVKDYGKDKKVLTDIINQHLKLLERRNFSGLSKKLGLTLSKTKELADIIFTLEPKPGRSFSQGTVQYITPDIYIKEVGKDFVVVLNEDGMPKLQLSSFYKSAIMKDAAKPKVVEGSSSKLESEAQTYIQDKLKAALWLIKSIHQRQKTLYKVTKSIAKFQRDFLEKGVQHLKPLVLRDVADEIGVHESTVSRATNGKYVHTPQGIFELKYFFNTGISNSAGGQDFANEAVKQIIKQLIDSENVRSPLSDQALADMLKNQNITIARRTIAKYREMMGILPSSRRKRLG